MNLPDRRMRYELVAELTAEGQDRVALKQSCFYNSRFFNMIYLDRSCTCPLYSSVPIAHDRTSLVLVIVLHFCRIIFPSGRGILCDHYTSWNGIDSRRGKIISGLILSLSRRLQTTEWYSCLRISLYLAFGSGVKL